MKKFLLLMGLLIFIDHVKAQISEPKIDLENLIRNHPDFNSDDLLQQDIISKIEDLQTNPISLNTCEKIDILQIPFVRLNDAEAIINHREKNGLFLCKEELMAVDSLKADMAKWISNFVFINKQIINVFGQTNGFQQTNIELKLTRIYQSKNAETFPQQVFHDLIKMKMSLSTNWSFGFSLENDAGEVYQSIKNGVFDFKSAHLNYKGNSKIKQFVLGDYRLFYGQGLALGFGFAPGKGAQVLNTLRFNSGINKFSSFDEARFLRGTAVSIDFRYFDLDLFYSRVSRDAAISNDSLNLGFLVNSGLHRTSSEIEKKNKVLEELMGLRTAWKKRNWNADLIIFKRVLIPGIQPEQNKLYQYWRQNTSNYFLGSGHLKYQIKNLMFATEMVLDHHLAKAWQFCALAALHSKLDAVLMIRNYDKDYSNPFANGLSEWGNTNERGMYWGMVYQYNKHLSFSAYSDYYYSDWIRYRFNALKWGFDRFFEMKYELRSGLKANCRFKIVNSEEWVEEKILGIKKYQMKVQLQFKLNDYWESLSRWDQNTETLKSHQTSGLFFQELKWKQKKFQLNLRYTIFHATQSASIQYASESELNGVFGLNTYSGNGFAGFILVQTQLFKMGHLGLKIGYLESDKLKKPENELKVQLRIRI